MVQKMKTIASGRFRPKPEVKLVRRKMRPHENEDERVFRVFWEFARRPAPPPNCFMALLGMEPRPVEGLIEEIHKGFPFQAFASFQHVLEFPAKDVASLLQMSHSTLARRKEQRRLAPDESELLVRFSRLFGLAVELFEGDAKAARHWMQTPKKPLDGATPLEMARTELGAREVEKLIDRLENGVFS